MFVGPWYQQVIQSLAWQKVISSKVLYYKVLYVEDEYVGMPFVYYSEKKREKSAWLVAHIADLV